MAGGRFQIETATGYGALGPLTYDGNYIWCVCRSPSANARLMRFSPTLKKFIKPDGTPGDYTNAYVDLGSDYYGAGQTAAISNGSVVGLADGQGGYNCQFRSAADMSHVTKFAAAGVSKNTGAFYYNGYWYWPGFNGGKSAIYATNGSPGSWVYVGTVGSYFGQLRKYGNMVLAVFEPARSTIERINPSTWTRDWTSDTAGSTLADVTYDPVRDEIWCAVSVGECVRMRPSDGLFLKRDATVGTYAQSFINGGDDSLIYQGTTVLVNGENLWAGGSGTSGFCATRRSTSPVAEWGAINWWSAKSNGHWFALPNHPCPQVVVNGTVYFSVGGPLNAYSWTGAAIGWVEDTTPAISPKLTTVTPMAGPKTRLVFDLAVNVGSPTIGSPAGGFGVTGVSQVDDTTLDVNMDFPPTHPLGEAEDVTPPTPPEGGGAVVV